MAAPAPQGAPLNVVLIEGAHALLLMVVKYFKLALTKYLLPSSLAFLFILFYVTSLHAKLI